MRSLNRLAAVAVSLALTATSMGSAHAASSRGRFLTSTARSATPNSVPPPTNYSYYLTESAGETHVTGRSVGPNAYTYYGKATIKGFTTVNGKRKPSLSIVQYPSPLVGLLVPSSISGGMDGRQITRPIMQPDTWYQPWTWNWPKILGTSWDYVYNGCLHGALVGAMGAIGTQAAVGWLVRGAEMYLGPEAVVAVAIGGCWADLTSGP